MPFITDEDNLGKALILNASEKMSDFLNLCARWQTVTWEELDNVITVGVWDPDKQLAMFNEVHAARQRKSMPCLVPGLLTRLRVAVSHSFHVADKIGGVSGVGSMVFDDHRRVRSWHIYNPRILTANFNEGNFGRIAGLPRRGKTNTGCVWMEQWASQGNIAFSNIMPDPEAPIDPRYQYVKDALALFQAVAIIPDGVKWSFILDEGGLMYSKADAATTRNKELDKFVRVIGKLHGNLIIIEQRPESVPTIVQDFATSLFYCESPGIVDIELKGPMLAFRDRVKDFPKTSLPMQTYDIAYFNINVKIVPMLNVLSGKKDVKDALRMFLEESGHDLTVRQGRVVVKDDVIKIERSDEPRNCLYCGKPLPEGTNYQKRYCNNSHKSMAGFQRRQEREREAMKLQAETGAKPEEPEPGP